MFSQKQIDPKTEMCVTCVGSLLRGDLRESEWEWEWGEREGSKTKKVPVDGLLLGMTWTQSCSGHSEKYGIHFKTSSF